MNNSKTNLSKFGYSDKYFITENGTIYKCASASAPLVKIDIGTLHRVTIKDKDNKAVRICIKKLYREVY